MILNQKITLDLTIDRVQNVHCSQDDDESRKILITLSDKGKPYTVPTNSVIHLKISKPDGTFVYIDEDDTSHLYRNTDGTIAIILSDQATCVPGICESEFQIIESNTIVTSRKFNIIVKKSVIDGKIIESAIESNIINKMIKHLIDFANPHKVTKSQVGLGNVPNVTTNNQTPTYTEATDLENISSGEKLSVAFGKIKKAINVLIAHMSIKSTTLQEGHVKLTDSITSNSIDTAVTPNSVKKLNDKIEEEKENVITHEQIDSLFL